MFHQDFVTWIKANSALTAVISGRVYPRILPQNATLPALVYSQTSGMPAITMTEVGGYTAAIFQLSCMGENYGEAKSLAKTVRGQLHGFKGTMGATNIQAAFQIGGDEDVYDVESEGNRVDLEFAIHYDEV